MLYAFSHATRSMVRGLAGDDLMLARINFIVLAQFKQTMDARRFFCFAKNRVPLMTGSIAVVGGQSSVVGGLPALSLMPCQSSVIGCRSSVVFPPYAFRLKPCQSSVVFPP
jgi:hypothetical protein